MCVGVVGVVFVGVVWCGGVRDGVWMTNWVDEGMKLESEDLSESHSLSSGS